MSWSAVKAAFKADLAGWDNANGNHGRRSAARAVLVALAYRSNIEGQAWPSLATLTDDTGLSRAAVCRALDGLVEAGLVQVIHRLGRSSVFHVDPSQPETYPSQPETGVVSARDPEVIKEQVKRTRRDRAHARNCPCHGTGWLDSWDPAVRALIAVPCPDGPQAADLVVP